MKNRKYLVFIVAFALIIGISGCSKKGETNSQSAESASVNDESVDTETVEEDATGNEVGGSDETQPEHMDSAAITGSYADRISQRATMDIVYNDAEEYYEVVIRWGSSATETTQWTMTAYDGGNTNELTYEDCSCDNLIYGDDDSFESKNIFQGGKGKLTVNEDMTISWKDNNGGEHEFEKM